MGKSFYRFRSTNNLLDGYSELEKQTIYFARPEQLNDPMEGYRDIYWRGDLIAWKNLFAHYVFCLERISSLLLISGEDNKIDADHIPVFGSTDDLPTDSYKNLFRKIKARFLENKYVSALILAISKRSTPIRREELAFYYDCMHIPALKLIFDVYIEENLSQEGNRIDDKAFAGISGVVSNDFVGLLEKSITDGEADQVIVNELFKAKSHIKQQSNLIHKHNGTISSSKPNKNLLMIDFPSLY